MNEDDILREITTNKAWPESSAQLCIRARFKCEYCDLDFLESPVAYKQIQFDHIVPRRAKGPDSDENLAVVCRTCNMDRKSRWNPAEKAVSPGASRSELVAACRQRVRGQREKCAAEGARILDILSAAQLGIAADGASPRR